MYKRSESYKIIIPASVEKIIRILCERVWTTEWSGVLFYTPSGSFEDGSLEIHCVDIFPMDIGNATYTEFNMSPDVISYMAQKPELLDCKMGLIHSHNNMATFFSSTDISTLREEGNDRNHFVSLIVNNAGKYTAAITRKIKYHSVRDLSYEGFNGPVKVEGKDEYDGEEIEYFNLEIVMEEPTENVLGEISERLDEIKKKKSPTKTYEAPGKTSTGSMFSDNYDYESMWDHYQNKSKVPTTTNVYDKKYPSLFEQSKLNKEEAEEETGGIISKKKLNEIITQLVTGSVTITALGKDANEKVINSMESRFDKRFGKDPALNQFEYWAIDFIEFLLWWSVDMEINSDEKIAEIAQAIIAELNKLPKNCYIDKYIEILTDYVGKYQ